MAEKVKYAAQRKYLAKPSTKRRVEYMNAKRGAQKFFTADWEDGQYRDHGEYVEHLKLMKTLLDSAIKKHVK